MGAQIAALGDQETNVKSHN